MTDPTPCARCKQEILHADNERDILSRTNFQIIRERTKSIRIFGIAIFGPYSRLGSRNHWFDEEQELCGDCAHQLIGRFLQGRSTPAIPGKENH